MNMESNVAIRCEGLTKQYKDVRALKDLNLSIPAGTVFGFLGRNGAGKTTTIRLLTGLAHPTEGHAWIGGVETTNGDDRARQRFGYLPQDPAFYGWMTPREYLDYVLGLFEVPIRERKSRVEESLQHVGLQKAAKRRIAGFSGGMVQRLGIAQAMIHQPPVLLLDEPTSALDPAGRHEVLELIDGLRGQVTIFLSTHILTDVERVCDRIGVIHEGVLLFETGREELMSRYDTSAIVLEVDSASLPIPDSFVQGLEKMAWVNTVVFENQSVRISVSDIETAKKELLSFVVAQGIVLQRYQWVRPTLEEIFLQVSSEGGE
jgi:ABC-2 type transport system ATP-binding protein